MRKILALLIMVSATFSEARDLRMSSPEAVGMVPERLGAITPLLQRYVEEGKIPGIVTVVSRRGRVVYYRAFGARSVQDSRPMERDNLFRIYSMTKPVTSVAAMILYEEGRFQLTDPISRFLPEFTHATVMKDDRAVPAESPVTMHHLLTHTGGFTYGFHRANPVDANYQDRELLAVNDSDDFVRRLAGIPLLYEPGERWHYSIATDLLGAVVERISGQNLDQFFYERIFEPLEMEDTFFDVPTDKVERFLPNQRWDTEEQRLVPYVEEDYPVYQGTTFFSGGGGLVSTAMDYMRFAEMLRRGGELHGERILSPKTVAYMTRNHLTGLVAEATMPDAPTTAGAIRPGVGFGLGFSVITDPVLSQVIGSVGEYSWGGAAGTLFWIDPVEEMTVVSMIQVMASPWTLRTDLKVITNTAIIEMTESIE